MTDEELTLAVARAMGLKVTRPMFGGGIFVALQEFKPLTDPKWAAQMMCWLIDRGWYMRPMEHYVVVEDIDESPIVLVEYKIHPTKSAAILRCLAEAVAKVGEES